MVEQFRRWVLGHVFVFLFQLVFLSAMVPFVHHVLNMSFLILRLIC